MIMEKNTTPAKTQVYNLVILDKSGSMESIKKEAIDGYNETLGAIRAAQLKHIDTQEHFVSLAAFCGCWRSGLQTSRAWRGFAAGSATSERLIWTSLRMTAPYTG